MKKQIVGLLNKLPYVRGLVSDLNYYKYYNRFAPGHYHNPIPDKIEIEEHYSGMDDTIEDISFDFQKQEAYLKKLLPYYKEMPWDFSDDLKNKNFRYKNAESYYRYSDAVFLYLIMREYKPKNIIEVGSGFSSAIMLDTNDLCFNDQRIKFTFIEPNPQDRLDGLINAKDRENCTIHVDKVQNVDVSIYKELQENDILFIDSSHLSKAGSDLNFLLFNVLPILNKGVIIHFHDIFYPFEYPKDWLTKERFYWNECYILRAFMMNNSDYEIVFFNSAAHKFQHDFLKVNMPETLIDNEHCGAIWIQKVK